MTHPPTDPRHWRDRRVERRRRRVFTMPVLPVDNLAVQAYLWRVIPAAVGRTVADPVDAERHRLADYLSSRHTPRLCRMLGLGELTPEDMARHLLTLDLYALRMVLVDTGLHIEPTLRDKRLAAEAREREKHKAAAVIIEALPDTGDVTRDFALIGGVLHRTHRVAYPAHPHDLSPVIRAHTRPVYGAWTIWCGRNRRTSHIRRALTHTWARTPDGQVLSTAQIRARVNPYGQTVSSGR